MNAELFRKLASFGLSVEQIGSVMDVIEERDAILAAKDAERKAQIRARVQKFRAKNKPETLRNVTETDGNASKRLTRGEDNYLTTEITGQEEIKSLKREIEREFHETFWPAYPKKAGKPLALKAFFAARKRAELPDIMAGLRRYVTQRMGQDPQYTKHAQGWLSGDHWNDEPLPAYTPPPRAGPAPAPQPTQDFNSILDAMQGKPHVPQHSGPTIDASYERRDRGGVADIVQFHAVSARR